MIFPAEAEKLPALQERTEKMMELEMSQEAADRREAVVVVRASGETDGGGFSEEGF